MATIKVKRLKGFPDAVIPNYAHFGDAGLDLYAAEDVTVKSGCIGRIRTGIAIEIPDGYVGLCWDKSGLAMNQGIKVLGGVMDAGFRGEYILGVINHGRVEHTFKKGHKVMQMLIQKVENVDIKIVEELSDSHRGEKGFGSSGK